MNRQTIIRAWKDPEYRASLSSTQRATLPEHPSGKSVIELSQEALEEVVGGGSRIPVLIDFFELNPAVIELLSKQTTPVVDDVPVTSPHHLCF